MHKNDFHKLINYALALSYNLRSIDTKTARNSNRQKLSV